MNRYQPILLSAAVLAACGQPDPEPGLDPAPVPPPVESPEVEFSEETKAAVDETFARELDVPAHYAEGWEVTPGWPGEYPPGFSILKEGVTVEGRETMDPTTDATLTCPLPRYATYQEWNGNRVAADDLRFAVATKLFDITVNQDISLDVPGEELEDPARTLNLKAGDTLVYKRYLGEGFAIIAHDGADYEFNEMDLRDATDIDTAGQDGRGGEDLWVQVTCSDAAQTRAWLLYDDVSTIDGIGPTPIMGYGESRDIMESDIAEIERQMEYDASIEDEPAPEE